MIRPQSKMFSYQRSIFEYVFVLLLCFLLAAALGCTKVGPEFVRPDSKVQPSWSESGDERINSGQVDYRKWWRVFNDPELNKLIEQAYRENLSLRIAGTRVLQARARLGIVVGDFYPQTQTVSGSVVANRTSDNAAFGGGISYSQAQIGANVGWELDFWGRFRRAIEGADAAWLVSVANYDNTLISLTADVAAAYIQIRTLQKRIAIARENARLQKENLSIAESRYRYGTVSLLDVEQARTVLNNTLALVPSLEIQLRQTVDSLSVLLGSTPGSFKDLFTESGVIPVTPPQVAAGIPVDLLRRRPDVRSAEYAAWAQCAQIGIAKADFYPAFSLNGTFGLLTTNTGQSSISDLFQWGSRTYQVGPLFQWNIFNYGRIANNVRLQDALFQELLLNYQNTVLSAQRDVEDNLASFLRSQERAALLAQSTETARRALELAVLQYRRGARDFTAVLLAEQALLTEQDNLTTTLGTLAGSLVGVYRALGGGWEIREGEDFLPSDIKAEMTARTDWGKLLAPAAYNPSIEKRPEARVHSPDW